MTKATKTYDAFVTTAKALRTRLYGFVGRRRHSQGTNRQPFPAFWGTADVSGLDATATETALRIASFEEDFQHSQKRWV